MLSFWIAGPGTKGALVDVNDATVTTLVLYGNSLLVRSDNGSSLTNATLSTASTGSGDLSAVYGVASNALTVQPGKTLWIRTGTTFAPGEP